MHVNSGSASDFTMNTTAITTRGVGGPYAMAGPSSRTRFTEDEVLGLLDSDGEDGGIDEPLFPGSDEELDHVDTESEREDSDEEM